MAGHETVATRQWPFMGRDDERQRVRGALADPVRRGFVLVGAAGVGKSTLADECLRDAAEDGHRILRAAATPATQEIPLGALAHLVPFRGPIAAQDRADLLRLAATSFHQPATTGGRTVLLVDDAHLLDELSATVVHQVALSGAAFVLLTVRASAPVVAPVLALWKDGLIERLDVPVLGHETLDAVLATYLGGSAAPGSLDALLDHAEGNVLYLRELTLSALADGALRCEAGTWRLARTPPPSELLVRLIEARLADRTPEERHLLELLAVGEPLDASEVEELGFAGAAAGLETAQLLAARSDGNRVHVGAAHPLYTEVIRRQMTVLRTRVVAAELAALVESRDPTEPETVLRLGRWRLIAGGGHPDDLLRAAELARWRYDFGFAERLANAAVAQGAGASGRLLLAELAGLQGRWEDAEAQLASLQVLAGTERDRARIAAARMDNLLHADRALSSMAIADEVEGQLTDPREHDEIRGRRTALLVNLEGPARTLEAARPLLARATDAAFVWASLSGGWAAARLGRADEALAIAAAGEAAHQQLDQPIAWYRWFHDFNRCEALLHAGRLAEGDQVALAQYERSLADGSPEAQAAFGMQRSKLLIAQGRVATGLELAREAAGIYQRLGRRMFLRESQVVAVHALCLAGDVVGAVALHAEIERPDGPPAYYDAVNGEQVAAWLTAAAGDVPAAIERLECAAALGEGIGDLAGAMGCLHAIARLGRPRAVTDRMDALAAAMDGLLPAARARHVRSLVAGDPVALLDASAELEAIGAILLASDAAADAAVASRRGGDRRASTRAERRATTLRDRCEHARTPATLEVELRAHLTPAERETALLAAAGRSNKEIAAELVLSVRSVENRLQHVYEKLGVCRRQDLGALINVPTRRAE